TLVVAVALVGTHELDQFVGVGRTVSAANNDLFGIHVFHGAVMGSQDADAGVGSSLVLHTGSNNGLLGDHQRHGLPLHVGTHQSTVTVVVLQERDAGRSNGNHHTGRNVHEIDLVGFEFLDVVAMTAGNAGTDKTVVLIQRFVGLRNDVFVFHVSGHINRSEEHTSELQSRFDLVCRLLLE